MKKRIIGIDVARAIAVIGMILVNFKIAFGQSGSEIFKSFASLFEGKAAATFVVLAGVGIALMTNSAIQNKDSIKIKSLQFSLLKKSIFLFVIGLLYIPLWIADILHFYGIYMIFTILLLTKSKKFVLLTTLSIILLYPFFFLFLNYETGWDFNTLEYVDFWTINGFIRNLFFNGFHPVLPWVAFMLVGLWYGKQNLYDHNFIKKSIWISLFVFSLTLLLSYSLQLMLSDVNQISTEDLKSLFGTSPMPPFPLYMISGSSIAIFIISTSIFIANKLSNNKLISALKKMGQLALTFYVAHVILGMGIVELINPEKMGNYTIEFSVIYAFIFSLLCLIFASVWLKYYKIGPLEWLMRKMTN